MLPPSVSNMVSRLRERTEKGEMTWSYDEADVTVSAELPEFAIQVRYRFSMTEQVGRFGIEFSKKSTGKDYLFWADERSADFQTLERLYDCALASELGSIGDLG